MFISSVSVKTNTAPTMSTSAQNPGHGLISGGPHMKELKVSFQFLCDETSCIKIRVRTVQEHLHLNSVAEIRCKSNMYKLSTQLVPVNFHSLASQLRPLM